MFVLNGVCLLFLTLVGVSSVFGQYEGDPCTLESGQPGICKLLTSCEEAAASLQKGKFPKICGFRGTQSIVCCLENVQSSLESTTAAPVVAVSNRKPGEISKKKCKEFGQYVWEKQPPAILLVGAEETESYECPYEKLELIVGGTLASRKEFPHMALVGYQTGDGIGWYCGGSLISEEFVLTAGHCLTNRAWGDAKFIRLGITNQTNLGNVQQFRIKQIIKHPDYEPPSHYNDIGLFRMEKKANMNSYARPACLFTGTVPPVKHAIASGWGKIDFSEAAGTNDLLKVVLEFFDQPKCNKTYKSLYGKEKLVNGIRDDIMICAGSKTELKDTCQGDSGGPLQIYHDESDGIKCMYEIVGVTSFGKACGLAKNVPGVYVRVSHYVKWIEDNVWPS